MINLSQTKKDSLLLDPFCGLGTVLQESLSIGYTAIAGSDLEQKQISGTKENLSWLAEKNNLSLEHVLLRVCDARSISSCFPDMSFDGIVTEPYLGPIMGAHSTHVDTKTLQTLCTLYVEAFREWKKVLKKNARVVAVFPFWIFSNKKIFLPCVEEIIRLDYKNVTIPQELVSFIAEKTDRDSILIAREDQHVGRELFVFQAN